jgi:SAM-dependent methyltransferase
MNTDMKRFSSPKRRSKPEHGKGSWYSYYAGFSSTFVADVLRALPSARSNVLDPWNGSGTTTQVAHEYGLSAVGYDLNPVMVIIAKARLLGPEISPSEISICQEIISTAANIQTSSQHDPLARWFLPSAVESIRSLERAVASLLIPKHSIQPFSICKSLNHISSLAAFFYVALFRVVRELLGSFRSSNPTWTRIKIKDHERINPIDTYIVSLLWKHVRFMASTQLQSRSNSENRDLFSTARVDIGTSIQLQNADHSFALVLSSPPYCTRIDYTMATLPELSLLGFGQHDFDVLRRNMIGTATINSDLVEPNSNWGSTCLDLLEQINKHQSYASKSYYYRNFLQYFDGLHKSLSEINRVLRPGGYCILVVQDSYYKDLHIDLARIIGQRGDKFDWELTQRLDFPSLRNLTRINSKAVSRRALTTESVLWFIKSA